MNDIRLVRALSVVMALAALVAGYAHLKLFFDTYDEKPDFIGPQFLLNAIAAAAIAAGVLYAAFASRRPAWLGRAVAAGAVVWAAVSLVAFYLARHGGWFGFEDEKGLNPSPEAALSVFPEIIVGVCGLALLALWFRAGARRRA